MNADGVVLWRELLDEATGRLTSAGLASAAGEARRIVAAAAGCGDAAWLAALSRPATRRGVAHFDSMLTRRAAGEPLQYVLGSWGFRTLDLFVDPRVLIPRPETEIVAGYALAELRRRSAELVADRGAAPLAADDEFAGSERGGAAPPRSTAQARAVAAGPPAPSPRAARGSGAGAPTLLAADLGCGSGAIGLSLAAERVDVEVICTDLSAEALAVASANLAGLGRTAARVRLVEGSWYEALPADLRGRFDVIASNPPYIASGCPLPAEIAEHEPPVALYSGSTGLEATEVILAGAPEWLAPGGAVVLELADDTADRVWELAWSAGLAGVAVHRDLAGIDRVLIARRM